MKDLNYLPVTIFGENLQGWNVAVLHDVVIGLNKTLLPSRLSISRRLFFLYRLISSLAANIIYIYIFIYINIYINIYIIIYIYIYDGQNVP